MLRAVFGIQFGHPVVAGITGRGRCATFFGLVCEARPRLTHDYILSVNGVVAAEDGAPLKDAEIILEVNGPVYQAVTLVRTVKRSTDSTGRFVFMYISHKRGVKYAGRASNLRPFQVAPLQRHTIRFA